MNVVGTAIQAAEGLPWPDPVLRFAVNWLVGSRQRSLPEDRTAELRFARSMGNFPIATDTKEANEQHYELPSKFFELMLGPQRKYSCCLYNKPSDTLAQAEENALAETAIHADLHDGQHILELGCGWGSLSLWMARNYPNSLITSVSNSHSQRAAIEQMAAARGLSNLIVITADMNRFEPNARFDRIVSVEMFEHMSNWEALLRRCASWLKPDGRLFVHVFAHRNAPYRFDTSDPTDWIAKYFFTGGIMPSHGLMHQFGDIVKVENDWWWSGEHYSRTAEDWLVLFDRNEREVSRILSKVYGDEATVWHRRWRLFLLATSGLFGHRGGREWGVSHYRLRLPD